MYSIHSVYGVMIAAVVFALCMLLQIQVASLKCCILFMREFRINIPVDELLSLSMYSTHIATHMHNTYTCYSLFELECA